MTLTAGGDSRHVWHATDDAKTQIIIKAPAIVALKNKNKNKNIARKGTHGEVASTDTRGLQCDMRGRTGARRLRLDLPLDASPRVLRDLERETSRGRSALFRGNSSWPCKYAYALLRHGSGGGANGRKAAVKNQQVVIALGTRAT